MPFLKRIDEGTDDTEGNACRVHPAPVLSETDDTEGNMPLKRGAVSDGVEDDTEGNRFHGTVSDGVEDDTEGNTVRSGRSVPPAANPGKAAKFKG